MSQPAIFLDRDGTLIEDMHYPRDPEKVRWIEGAKEALLEFQKLGFLLFVVSNQSGVGRGIIKDHEFKQVHDRVCYLLKEAGIEIREFAYCLHKPEDQCECRKPQTKLIRDLSKTHQIDLRHSYTIGDKWTDVLLGMRVGATGILLSSKTPEPPPSELENKSHVVLSHWLEITRFVKASHLKSW
ncbi:MAG: D-glycero-alpha-D-manno-heptose-1,7-bisphosphate 7-phosphatase [Pseudomonadota bacterium]